MVAQITRGPEAPIRYSRDAGIIQSKAAPPTRPVTTRVDKAVSGGDRLGAKTKATDMFLFFSPNTAWPANPQAATPLT